MFKNLFTKRNILSTLFTVVTISFMTVSINAASSDTTKKATTIQQDIDSIKATQKVEYGDKNYTYEQLQKDFEIYFQGKEKERVVAEFKKYVDSKLVKDGYSVKKVSEAIKAKYYEKYSLEFVQYAAQNGLFKVPSTELQKTQGTIQTAGVIGTITKYSMRLDFWTASKILSAAGYRYTAEMLSNSLQDAPPTLIYNVGDNLSNFIKTTQAYKTEMNNFKNKLSSQKGTYYEYAGSMALVKSNSNTDMYLAMHNVAYRFWANKSNGRWNINVRIFDVYNFEYWKYPGSGVSSTVITLANNYGALAQQMGAIVPYNIFIYATDYK